VGAKLSAFVQTGSGTHTASYNGYWVSFPGVKRPRRGVNHLCPTNAEVKERVELYHYCPSGPSWPTVRRAIPLPFRHYSLVQWYSAWGIRTPGVREDILGVRKIKKKMDKNKHDYFINKPETR
jgi:hypothetical protein